KPPSPANAAAGRAVSAAWPSFSPPTTPPSVPPASAPSAAPTGPPSSNPASPPSTSPTPPRILPVFLPKTCLHIGLHPQGRVGRDRLAHDREAARLQPADARTRCARRRAGAGSKRAQRSERLVERAFAAGKVVHALAGQQAKSDAAWGTSEHHA